MRRFAWRKHHYFIDDEYVEEHDENFYDDYDNDVDETPVPKYIQASLCADEMVSFVQEPSSAAEKSLQEYMKQLDRSFQETLFDLIDESGMTDVVKFTR